MRATLLHYKFKPLIARFLGGVFLAAGAFSEASSRTEQLLEQISDSKPENPNLKNAIQLLRSQINRTRSQLPAGFTNEFEQSIEARLQLIQVGVSQYIVPEYKTAIMAKRLLDLSENVLTLGYRRLPQDAEQRKKAHQQYAAVLEGFEKGASEAAKHLDDNSRNAITQALRKDLTDVQRDIFCPGYGQPLGEEDKAGLGRIIGRLLKAAAALPAAAEKKRGTPSGLAAAGRAANEVRQAVLKFLRDREAALAKNESYVRAVTKWHLEIRKVEQAVDRETDIGAEAELKAMQERGREQAEKDRIENDPKNIERKNNVQKVGPLL